MSALVPSRLASDTLARRLGELAGDERHVQVDFLLHLDEFDRRRAFLELGHDSLWSYCLRVLHLREGPAGRRIGAMRVLRRFPALEVPLRDGRLCLSTVTLLGPLLTAENLDDLVARAAYRTKAEVEHLVARAAPRDGIRKVAGSAARGGGEQDAASGVTGMASSLAAIAATPAPAAAVTSDASLFSTLAPAIGLEDTAREARDAGGSPAPAEPASTASAAASAERECSRLVEHSALSPAASAPRALPSARGSAPAEPRRPAELRAVSAEEWSLRVTIDAALKSDLETLRDLLSHSKGGDLAAVLREAVRCAIEKHGRRKGMMKPSRTRASTDGGREPAPGARAVPAAVRREVWERDGGCCTWIGTDGRRCGSRWKLELDHIRPVALGGASTADNVRTLCRQHNALHAAQVFGREHMARFEAGSLILG